MDGAGVASLELESPRAPRRAWLEPVFQVVDAVVVPLGALLAAMLIFSLFILLTGNPPLEVLAEMYRGAFGTWFSFENTLLRAAPLMLTGLCTALPARLGLIVIGAEGAMVMGGVAAAAAGLSVRDSSPLLVISVMMLVSTLVGGPWIGLAGALRAYRGVNETISSLLLAYLGIAILNHLVEGPLMSFTLSPGSFHALLGENGAGKSTLVKCIMGFYKADAGELRVGEQRVTLKSPKDAQRQGIGMVYQHFTLVDNMTVAENLVLSRANVPSIVRWKHELEAIESFMGDMPFRVPIDCPVRKLSAGEKQKLEILKQLYLGSRIIILDEPTSVLTPQEADEVLGMLRDMAGQGQVSVAMITHRFREVTEFADEVTVLRRGRRAGGGKTGDFTPEALAELMVGAEPPRARLERNRSGNGGVAAMLEVNGLTAMNDIGLPVLNGVNLKAYPGEIVGIAGVSGNGQDELVEVLAGQRGATGGSVRVAGRPYRATRAQIRERKVRLLPEAPLTNACVSTMTVAENLSFRSFDQPPFAWLRWALNRRALFRHARTKIAEYKIKAPSPSSEMGTLSGGNVQRTVLARELDSDLALLIAANPCFGLDFAAVSEVRGRIMQARNNGTAVLLVSADLEEVFALADRILVMSGGRLVYEVAAEQANVQEIGRNMAGHHA